MRFDIITIFPNIFTSYFNESIIGRAQKKKLIKIVSHDLRKWTKDRHKTVDDKPYGGGPGMLLKVEPIYKAVESIKKRKELKDRKVRTILFSAKGKQFNQAMAKRLVKYDDLILICGRYEGVDDRVARHVADEEISIGNYILTGGELPAMIMVDAISRLVSGVVGKKESLKEESFSKGEYLEYPQYTRPENFMGLKVPKVLLSGNHKKIEEWRRKKSKTIKSVKRKTQNNS